MTRVSWDTVGQRYFETGVDRGVLYVGTNPGVPWSGLTAVTEKSSGGSPTPVYVDGVKTLNLPASEDFEATIEAFTYPPEFGACDGSAQVSTGLFVTQQRRKPFSFSYRTLIGNDVSGTDLGYKIHLVYNALAAPSQRTNASLADTANPNNLSWEISTAPPPMVGYGRTAHIVVDSTLTSSDAVSAVEDLLYGSSSNAPRMPFLPELVTLYEDHRAFAVIDNGDGTYTVNGPSSAITMLDADTFQIVWPTAVYIDADTYTLSSV